MIYLLDTSGLVRLLRDPKLQVAWHDAIDAGTIASCYVQRAEFLYSARNGREYDEIAEMFTDLYPDAAVPKNAGRWISSCNTVWPRPGSIAAPRLWTSSSPPPPPTMVWPFSTTMPTTGPSPGTQPTCLNTTSTTSPEMLFPTGCGRELAKAGCRDSKHHLTCVADRRAPR